MAGPAAPGQTRPVPAAPAFPSHTTAPDSRTQGFVRQPAVASLGGSASGHLWGGCGWQHLGRGPVFFLSYPQGWTVGEGACHEGLTAARETIPTPLCQKREHSQASRRGQSRQQPSHTLTCCRLPSRGLACLPLPHCPVCPSPAARGVPACSGLGRPWHLLVSVPMVRRGHSRVLVGSQLQRRLGLPAPT